MADSPVTAESVRRDLLDEQADLDTIVADLSSDQWDQQTPSPGWAVRDQIGHLAFFDHTAALAIADPDAFVAHREEFVAAAFASPEAGDEFTLGATRAMTGPELLAHWRHHRSELADASAGLADDARIEWYGPSMGAKSFLTARLMEAWAHGQDIADTLGVERRPTDRLRHIAQLGFITRKWTYVNRGLEVPPGDIRIDLLSPSGEHWILGPDEAAGRVSGTALDFCLVTSQRRHIDDTDLSVEGAIARDWLEKAQLFAGPPTDPPRPGYSRRS